MRMVIGLALVALCSACSDPEPTKTSDDVTMDATPTAPAENTAADMPEPPATTVAPEETAAAPASAPPVEDGPPIVYEGLKVTPTKAAKVKAIEVKADGSIVADGKKIGSFAKDKILDEQGTPVLRLSKDGEVQPLGPASNGVTAKTAKFDDKNDLVTPDGKLSLAKDGAFTFEKTGGKPESAPMKVVGVNDKNRRAAILLGTYLLFSSSEPEPSPRPTSGPALTGPAKKIPATGPATPPKKN